VSDIGRKRPLPASRSVPTFLGNPVVATGTKALAAGELVGDKMGWARIVAAEWRRGL